MSDRSVPESRPYSPFPSPDRESDPITGCSARPAPAPSAAPSRTARARPPPSVRRDVPVQLLRTPPTRPPGPPRPSAPPRPPPTAPTAADADVWARARWGKHPPRAPAQAPCLRRRPLPATPHGVRASRCSYDDGAGGGAGAAGGRPNGEWGAALWALFHGAQGRPTRFWGRGAVTHAAQPRGREHPRRTRSRSTASPLRPHFYDCPPASPGGRGDPLTLDPLGQRVLTQLPKMPAQHHGPSGGERPVQPRGQPLPRVVRQPRQQAGTQDPSARGHPPPPGPAPRPPPR